MSLRDKVVVITGGSKGFGKSLAAAFIAEGSKVAIVSDDRESLDKTAEEIGAAPFQGDVRNEHALRNIADEVQKSIGNIDIWVNNAGVFLTFPKGELLDMDRAHMQLDINFFGTVLGSRTALRCMEGRDGLILNVLSGAALDATRAKNAKLYAASKWAIRGYIDALRGENKDSTIKIFAVYPGGMKTDLYEDLPAEFGNFMDPDDVAQKVVENLKQKNPDPDQVIKRPGV